MKRIPGFENYLISESGQVFSLLTNRRLKHGYRGKPLYKCVGIGGKKYSVHVLVALTYIGPRPKGLVINHKDRNHLNNNVSNLEYVTQKENIKHINRFGMDNSPIHNGELNPASKLSEKDVLYIRENRKHYTYKEMSSMFNVTKSTIKDILTRRSWKHI